MTNKTFLGLERIGFSPKETPLENWSSLAKKWGIGELWVKREDQTHPYYGGNKVRKLDFLLAEAKFLGYKKVLTIGFAGSNHATATAVLAREVGLKPLVFLMDQVKQTYVWDNLLIHEKNQTEFLDPHKLMTDPQKPLAWLHDFLQKNKDVFWIPAGGTSSLGNMGYVEVAIELKEQFEELNQSFPARIYASCGTQGTVIGLGAGLSLAERKTEVHGVRVVDGDFLNEKKLQRNYEQQFHYLKELPQVGVIAERTPLVLREEFYGEGYALPTAKAKEVIAEVKDAMGLELEGTYTAKALAALKTDAEAGTLVNKSVCYIHTWHSKQKREGLGDGLFLPEFLQKYR